MLLLLSIKSLVELDDQTISVTYFCLMQRFIMVLAWASNAVAEMLQENWTRSG